MPDPDRIALFVGAGASKPFRFPLTREILPRIVEKLDDRSLFGPKEDEGAQRYRDQLMRFLGQVLPGLNKQRAHHILITEILSLLDLMIQHGTVPFVNTDTMQIAVVRGLLERAIFEAIEWPYDPANVDEVPAELRTLAGWFCDGQRHSHSAIISTNYDECIETEVYRHLGYPGANELIDFGLDWRVCRSVGLCYSQADAPHGVYKLHGSVSWLRCELCHWVTCNDEYTFGKTAYSATAFFKEYSELATCACGHWPLRSVMVAPSTVRDIRDPNLLSVWKSALEALRTADRWYIIGYSLPVEDVGIRSLLLRAYNGRENKPHIEVVQHGTDESTRDRYEGYFPSCVYHTRGMEDFIARIQRGDL